MIIGKWGSGRCQRRNVHVRSHAHVQHHGDQQACRAGLAGKHVDRARKLSAVSTAMAPRTRRITVSLVASLFPSAHMPR